VSGSADGPRERLSRERIVDVALAQMKESGYDAVSMRSIAKELGTGPASLYAHVANKDELDQLVIDRIATLVEVPEPDPERWVDQVKDVMRANLAAYRAHPGSAQAALAIIPTAEGGLRAAEGIMQLLLAGGVPPQAAAALPPATYPALTTYAAEMTTGDGDDRFEFGLDVLLAGLVAVSGRA